MAQYARVDGATRLQPVTILGQAGRCHSCGWAMVAKPGNGAVIPHWAHKPGSSHVISGNGEMGEWHQEVQNLFALQGATTEVVMPSADGQRTHFADVVLADGRIVEAQTHFLDIEQLTSREQTYGEMAWIYNAHDSHAWFIVEDTRTQHRFQFGQGKADRRFLSHTKPVYFDTADAIWRLDSITRRPLKGGRTIWEGTRTKAADGLLEFVDAISRGDQFGPSPRMPNIDPRRSISGTSTKPLQDRAQWEAEHPTCDYQGVEEPARIAPAIRPPLIVDSRHCDICGKALTMHQRRRHYSCCEASGGQVPVCNPNAQGRCLICWRHAGDAA